jgi:D-3-phosphoglycerate dehydrogenase / 2-oxoglutarate reductase
MLKLEKWKVGEEQVRWHRVEGQNFGNHRSGQRLVYLTIRDVRLIPFTVGLIVARLAKGLGMKVHGLDPYANPSAVSALSITLMPSLSALLPTVDFLTIHTPLIASTKGMISTTELSQMKKGSRIFNVARGGTIDETALLQALESGHIAGAGIDVFSEEPPSPESPSFKLIEHPNVTATCHLGASTHEAQENVSIDVCEQVLSILEGNLPRSAVNAPLILPEEYKKLQPFVLLVEKMGSLYTQHFTSSHATNRTTFDLIYEGEISGINNTKPLFAALVKGLTSPISSSAGVNVNIVNAELIARERGIIVNEQHSREATHTYSSLVTLVARPPSRASSRPPAAGTAGADGSYFSVGTRPPQEQLISGYVSGGQIYISRLDRFATSFVPTGTLLICHNYDSPGKIGVVGSILGTHEVNINYMSVAPISKGDADDMATPHKSAEKTSNENEALMILGVNKEVTMPVIASLLKEGTGILQVSSITL